MAIDPLDEKNAEFLHFRLKKKDLYLALGRKDYIDKLLKNNRKGRTVWNNFFKLFELLEERTEKELNKKLKDNKSKIQFYFKYLNDDVVDYLLIDYEHHFSSKGKMLKKDFVKDCYNKVRELGYSHHKSGAITACIAMVYGYKMSGDIKELFDENLPISVDDFFQKVRTIVERYNK